MDKPHQPCYIDDPIWPFYQWLAVAHRWRCSGGPGSYPDGSHVFVVRTDVGQCLDHIRHWNLAGAKVRSCQATTILDSIQSEARKFYALINVDLTLV